MKQLEKTFALLWNNPPAPFNQDFIPEHEKMSQEIRKLVEKGEPYASREERKSAWDIAYSLIRPKYKSLRERI